MPANCDLNIEKTTTFGNNVSHSNRKTRTKFKLNLNKVSFYSETLKSGIRFRVASATIKTVEKLGGIDIYLTKTPNKKLSRRALKYKRAIASASKSLTE